MPMNENVELFLLKNWEFNVWFHAKHPKEFDKMRKEFEKEREDYE